MKEINVTKAKLEAVETELAAVKLALEDPSNEKVTGYLRKLTFEQLVKKEEQLREKENLLLKEKEQLREKDRQQQPGALPSWHISTTRPRELSRSAPAALCGSPSSDGFTENE